MPFTPYHFGPSGFVGLLFKRWLDLPVFVLANVVVDLEVLVVCLLDLGPPAHRYAHTLLGGAVLGVLWGLAAYPLRHWFRRVMHLLRLPYRTSLLKLVISGVLGVWLHVLIDGAYHPDVRIFWPSDALPLWRTVYQRATANQLRDFYALSLVATAVLYIVCMALRLRQTPGDE